MRYSDYIKIRCILVYHQKEKDFKVLIKRYDEQ